MKHPNFPALLLAAAGVLCAASAEATDYAITNDTSGTVTFSTAAIWSGGSVPANYRVWAGTNDTIYATNALASAAGAQTLKFAQANDYSTDGSYFAREFIGGENRHLDAFMYSGTWPDTLTVIDMARWQGLVFSTAYNSRLRFFPGPTPSYLPQIMQDNGLNVTVRGGADRRVEIDRGSGRGCVWFNAKAIDYLYASDTADNGTVFVRDPLYGDGSTLMLSYGAAVFSPTNPTPAVVGDPYLHLDATVDSFVTEVAGGQSRVKTWYDCRGQEGHPYAYASVANYVPWLGTDTTSGKRVVDFGDSYCDYAWPVDDCVAGRRTGGWTGSSPSVGKTAWLKFSQSAKNVREVFLVVQEKTLYNCRAPFLGSDDIRTNHFARGFWNDSGSTPGKWNYCFYNLGTPFHSSLSSGNVRSGDIRVDGQRVRYNDTLSFADRLHVLSVGTTGDVIAGRIGDAGYGTYQHGNDNRHECVGGFTMGELLVYTNALTSAERRQVIDFLAAKWSAPRPDYDAANLVVGSSASVGAATGTTLRVAKTVLRSNALAVTGGGRLETGVLDATDATVAVKAGSVAFTKPFAAPAAAPDAPAALPDAWIDPTDLSTVTYATSENETVTNVSQVASREGCIHTGLENSKTLSRTYMITGNADKLPEPTLVADADVGGLRVLDCGTYCSGTTASGSSTFLMMYKQVRQSLSASDGTNTVSSVGGQYGTYSLFAVFKASDLRANICARYAQDIYRNKNSTGALFAQTSLATQWANGDFAIDGRRIDPYATKISSDEYHVLSIRVTRPIAATCFGGRGYNQGQLGGVRFGEILLYDRVLSDAEMRDTEAYLMKRWLKKDHPDNAAVSAGAVSLARVDFAAGSDATLESDYPLAVAKATSETGSLAAKGGSTIEVASLDSAVTNLFAAAGTARIGGSLDEVVADALFHFDASDLESLTTNTLGQVTEWRDTRANGYVARPLDDSTYVITNKPVWKTLAINGVQKPCVDLGPRCQVKAVSGVYTVTNTAAAFQIYDPNGSTGWSPRMREWIVVAKDMTSGRTTSPQIDHAPILSGTPAICMRSVDELHNYMTHPAYQHLKGKHPAGVYISKLDNTEIAYNYRLWENTDSKKWNFHVFSMGYLTNDVNWTFQVRHLGGEPYNSTGVFGGLQLCEAMVFKSPLTTADRDTITKHLMNKWLSNTYDESRRLGAIRVGTGATLDLSLGGWSTVSANALEAGGTLKTDRAIALNENAIFTVKATAPQTWTSLTVDGTLECPEAATVQLEIADGLRARDTYGDYLILTGADLTNPECMANWTLEYNSTFYRAAKPLLRVAADGLHLVIPKPGIFFIVR